VPCEHPSLNARAVGSEARRSRLKALVILVTLASSGAAALCAATSGQAAKAPLQKFATAAVGEYEKSARAVVGASAIDLRTGRTLIAVREGRTFVPASNQKLLTAAFALARLGKDFEFTTSVYSLGDDIVVTGDGDPTLGDPILARGAGRSIYAELDRWAAAVREKAAGSFTGDLIVCSVLMPRSFRHPSWPAEQHRRWYAAPVAGLNFHDNCYDVTFTVAGKSVTPHIVPASRFIRLLGRVTPGRRHLWSLEPDADDSQLRLSGTVRRSTKEPLSVAANNPPLLLGRVLAERLVLSGVKFKGEVRAVSPNEIDLSEARLLCRTRSPLAVALKRALKRSLNMAAECIFLRAGDGTWRRSAAMMKRTMVDEFGLDAAELVVSDGGGLSRNNRVSPKNVTRLLAGAARRKDAAVLLAGLPVSGVDGTMRKRLGDGRYRGRVLAKSGYVAGASALSGYVLDAGGRPAVAFGILVNRVPAGKAWVAKQLQDSLCRMLVDRLGAK